MTIKRIGRFAVRLAAISVVVTLAMSCALPSIYDHWDSLLLTELELTPSLISLEFDQNTYFSVVGGKAPYQFSLIVGEGAIGSLTDTGGLYSAPGKATFAIIQAQDANGSRSETRVSVAPPTNFLHIIPSIATLAPRESLQFNPGGGIEPYEFSMISGRGHISSNGAYTAPETNNVDVISVTDASGQYCEASITINTTALPLSIVPLELSVETNTYYKFDATGGSPPYSFAATDGMIFYSGGYFSPSTAGSTVTVTVTDDDGTYISSHVTVFAQSPISLRIVPRSITIAINAQYQFTAIGGTGSYAFSLSASNGGTISASGLYTAPDTRQRNVQVIVKDSRGIIDKATIKIKDIH